MKKHIVSSLVVALAFICALVRANAHPGGHDEKPVLPATVPEIVAAMNSQQKSLGKAIDDNKLDRVAPHARTIGLLVSELVDRSEGHHKSALRKMAANHDKLTAELIKASSAGSKSETTALFEKFRASIGALQAEAH